MLEGLLCWCGWLWRRPVVVAVVVVVAAGASLLRHSDHAAVGDDGTSCPWSIVTCYEQRLAFSQCRGLEGACGFSHGNGGFHTARRFSHGKGGQATVGVSPAGEEGRGGSAHGGAGDESCAMMTGKWRKKLAARAGGC